MSQTSTPPSWKEIESHPEYNALDLEGRKKIRERHFDDTVANSPEYKKVDNSKISDARKRWMADLKPPVVPEVEETGYLSGTAKSIGRGVFGAVEFGGDYLESNDEYMRSGIDRESRDESKLGLFDKAGRHVSEWAKELKENIPAPVYGDDELKRSWFQGVESLPTSVATMAPGIIGGIGGATVGGLVGSGSGPGLLATANVGRLAGVAGATALTSNVMYNATKQQTLEELDKLQKQGKLREGVTQDEKMAAAESAGHAEWQGEAPANIIESLIFSRLPAASLLKGILRPGIKQFGKNMVMSAPLEVAGEAYTSHRQAGANNSVLRPEYQTSQSEAAVESVGPTLVMTTLMNAFGVGSQRIGNSGLAKALEDPAVPLEQRTESIDKIGKILEGTHGADVANAFVAKAQDSLGTGGQDAYGIDLNDPTLLDGVGGDSTQPQTFGLQEANNLLSALPNETPENAALVLDQIINDPIIAPEAKKAIIASGALEEYGVHRPITAGDDIIESLGTVFGRQDEPTLPQQYTPFEPGESEARGDELMDLFADDAQEITNQAYPELLAQENANLHNSVINKLQGNEPLTEDEEAYKKEYLSAQKEEQRKQEESNKITAEKDKERDEFLAYQGYSPDTPGEKPEELRAPLSAALDKMASDVKNAELSKPYQNEEGDTTPAYSSFPEFFKQKTVKAYNKANGTNISLSKEPFEKLIQKIQSGKELTPKQQETYEYLKAVADGYMASDPEVVAEQEYSNLEKEGFKLHAPEKVNVGDLSPGDEVVIEKGGVPDKLTHMGFNENGDALLQDGTLIEADAFDSVEVISSKVKGESANREKVDAMVKQITESSTIEDVSNLKSEMPSFIEKNPEFEPYRDLILGTLDRRETVLVGENADDNVQKGAESTDTVRLDSDTDSSVVASETKKEGKKEVEGSPEEVATSKDQGTVKQLDESKRPEQRNKEAESSNDASKTSSKSKKSTTKIDTEAEPSGNKSVTPKAKTQSDSVAEKTKKTDKGIALYSKNATPLPKAQQAKVNEELTEAIGKRKLANLIKRGLLEIVPPARAEQILAVVGGAKFSRDNKQPWPDSFPNAKVHTTLSKMKAHADYNAAKAGDVEAAIRMVNDLVKPKVITELYGQFPNAIVVAPHAVEASGKNAIPQKLAETMGDAGFQVDTEIVQSSRAQRTKKKSALRLAILPKFDGKVEAGRDYILVDDALGEGGTVNELRYHIESNGGNVVFVSALTQGMYAAKISVKPETIKRIEERYGRTATEKFIREFDTAGILEALTEKQARTILRSSSLDTLRDKVLTQAQEADISSDAWKLQTPLSVTKKPEVKYSKDGKIEGFQIGSKAYLVDGNIRKTQAYPVLLHEIGSHIFTEERFKGEDWKNIARSFDRLSTTKGATGDSIRRAMDRVPGSTKPSDVMPEIVAYYLSDNANKKQSLYRQIVAKIKSILHDMGFDIGFHPDDIVSMAKASLSKTPAQNKTNPVNGVKAFQFSKSNTIMPKKYLDQARRITDKPAFKEWFGKSKISSNGRPHILYHGTSHPQFLQDKDYPWVFDTDRAVNQASSPLAGLGVFLGNDVIANAHSAGTGGTTHPFFVRIENPLVITADELEAKVNDVDSAKAFKKRAMELNGHDGIIISDRGQVIAFEKNQLKSAEQNSGEFSKENDDVRYSVAETDNQAMGNTENLNAERDGVTSTTSEEAGRKIIKEILRKLNVSSTPAVARDKFNDTLEAKIIQAYNDASRVINDERKSLVEKQKFAAAFANKLPSKPRSRLLAKLTQIARVKSEKGQQKKLNDFLGHASTILTDHLRRDLVKYLEDAPKRLKVKKGGVAKGRGAKLERELDFIRKAIEEFNSEERVLTEEAALERSIMDLQEELLTAEGKDREKAQEKLDDAQSKMTLIQIFSGIRRRNFDDLLNAKNALRTLVELGRMPWRDNLAMWRERHQTNQNMVAREITGEEYPVPEDDAQIATRKEKEKTIKGRVKESLSAISNSIQSWELLLDKIAKKSGLGTLASKTVEHFSNISHAATRDYEKMSMDTNDAVIAKAGEVFNAKPGRQLAKVFAKADVVEDNKVFIYRHGVKKSVPMSKLQSAYWYQISKGIQNNPAIKATFEKMGVTDQTLKQIESYMGEDVKRWADYLVEEFYQDFHYDTNEIYKQIYGIDLHKSKNYVPLKRIVAGEKDDKSMDGFLDYSQKSTKKGGFIERVYATNSFKRMSVNDVLVSHIADMTHFKAWALPTKEINGTFNSPEIQGYIEQHYGRSTLKEIRSFQDHFVKTLDEMKSDDMQFLDKWRGRVTTAMIGANPVVFLKQLSSIPAYASDIPAAEWVKYTAEFFANPVKNWKELSEGSTLMKARYRKGFERDVAQAMRKSGSSSLSGAKNIPDQLMMMTALGDKMAITVGGYAVYKYHLEKNLKAGMNRQQATKEAITQFEKSTERAQQSGNIKDLGGFQRGNSFQKLFTMFMTAPASYSRQIFTAARNIKQSPKDSAKRLFIFAVVLPMAFQAIADAMLGVDGDDEDKERFWNNQLKALALGPFNGLPILRTMVQGYYNTADGNGFYSDQYSPFMQTYDTSKKLVGDAKKWAEGGTDMLSQEEYLGRTAMDIVHLLGYGTGAPTKPVERIVTGIKDAISGDTDHPVRRSIGYSKYAVNE